MERLHYERGKAAFTLRDRLQKHRIAHPTSADEQDPIIADDDIEWFETDGDGRLRLRSKENPGSVGTTNEDTCEASKSETGNRKFKALFGQCRTHNEQILVWLCGVIFARATFYHAEAVSNVLVSAIQRQILHLILLICLYRKPFLSLAPTSPSI
jgi:hypothetical protein